MCTLSARFFNQCTIPASYVSSDASLWVQGHWVTEPKCLQKPDLNCCGIEARNMTMFIVSMCINHHTFYQSPMGNSINVIVCVSIAAVVQWSITHSWTAWLPGSFNHSNLTMSLGSFVIYPEYDLNMTSSKIFENKDALTYNNRYSSVFIDSISRFYSHVINAHLVDFPAIVVDCGTLIAPTWSFHPAMAANWAGVLC